MESPENPVAEEPCRCVPGFQCSEINCEYCERIPTCGGGDGLELDPGEMPARGQSVGKNIRAPGEGVLKRLCCQFAESTYGRKKCFPCKAGYFSTDNNGEECKQWTK